MINYELIVMTKMLMMKMLDESRIRKDAVLQRLNEKEMFNQNKMIMSLEEIGREQNKD
jgi:hypothetical protein